MESLETASNSRLHQAFTMWTKQNYAIGLDVRGDQRRYIPYAKLRQFADPQRLGDFLGSLDKDVDTNELRNNYLVIFFILVLITVPGKNWTVYFLHFYYDSYTDSQLPLPKPPERRKPPSHDNSSPFPYTSDGLDAWQEFYENQWLFLPLQFRDNRGVRIAGIHERTQPDPRIIIPVSVKKELQRNEGGSARILIVSPQESSGLPPNPIIMKEYSKSESEYQFKQEREAYTMINNIPDCEYTIDKYFLRYYGSFVHGDKCVILVEYADKGTLLDLFRSNQCLPRDELEARKLWKDLNMLFHALEIIHRRSRNNLAIHQDIKPANVFAFSSHEEPDRLLFKFGDFGLSSIKEPSDVGDAVGQDNHGSKMYSAPEICEWSEAFQGLPKKVTWAIDIWSLGCLFFETAVWMAAYEQGRDEFRQARVNETKTKKFDGLIRAGYRGAFHDGFDVLQTLRDQVRKISDLNTPVARLSVKVMEFALSEMLVPQKQRLNAEQLWARLRRVLDDTELQSSSLPDALQTAIATQDERAGGFQPPIGPDRRDMLGERRSVTQFHQNSHRLPSPSSPSETSARPYPAAEECEDIVADSDSHSESNDLTVTEVIEWIQRTKRNNEKLDVVAPILKTLKNRRQVLVIDNSMSMQTHWEHVKSTSQALSYLVKRISPGGVKIHMTNCSKSIRTTKTKHLIGEKGFLETNRPRDLYGPCHMEARFTSILLQVVNDTATRSFRQYLCPSCKIEGADIYVLTNGIWGGTSTVGRDGGGGGVEHAVEAAVRSVMDFKRGRTFLSIQFIRFGNDDEGKRRLGWLDNHIGDTMGIWDIVDTTYHRGSIQKMLIGSKEVDVDNGDDKSFVSSQRRGDGSGTNMLSVASRRADLYGYQD